MRADVSGLILAGGKATRMGGIDKHLLVVEGRTIFDRQVDALRGLEILVSSPREIAGHRIVRDAVPDAGPIAGIAAGLAAARTTWLVVVAGDMPFLTAQVIERLLALTSPDVDAIGVRVNGLPEPLVCVLRVAVYLPLVEARLARSALKVSSLLTEGEARVAWLDEQDVRPFFNVNVPEDL